MSLFDALFLPGVRAEEPKLPGPGNDYWYTADPSLPGAGGRVTPASALRASAVFACVRVLAESVSMLPLITYRRKSDDVRDRAREHWLYALLHDRPNRWQTAQQYIEQMMANLVLRGVHVSYKVPGPGIGETAELIPLPSDRVAIRQEHDTSLTFLYRDPRGVEQRYPQERVLWVPFLTVDGVQPITPIGACERSIRLALHAEEYGERYFVNDVSSSIAMLLKPATNRSEQNRQEFVESLRSRQTGPNRHLPLVVEGEGTIQQLQIGNRDAQFLETRQFQVADIARIFRVPPHLIGDLTRATFSNIEHQGIEFVTLTLMPWLVRIQQAIARDLIVDKDIFVEFLPDALLRGDLVSRYNAYRVAVGRPWKVPNEVRREDNLPPLEGGDGLFIPANMNDPGGNPEQSGQDGQSGQENPAPRRKQPPPDDDGENENAARKAAGSSPSSRRGVGGEASRKDMIVRRQVKKAVAVEMEAIAKSGRKHANDPAAWAKDLDAFYIKHALDLQHGLSLTLARAAIYCESNKQSIQDGGLALLEILPERSECELLALIEEDSHAHAP